MRCFVGLPLPKEYQDGLGELRREWGERLGPLNWTRPGNWHITLKFVGEAEEGLVREMIARLREVRFQGFCLRAGGGGFFPDRGAPRVAWVGLEAGGTECAGLAGKIEERLAGLGLPREEREFRPHLTLARVRREGRSAGPEVWREFAESLAGRTWAETRLERFVLWKSVLGPGGPRYEPLAEYRAG